MGKGIGSREVGESDFFFSWKIFLLASDIYDSFYDEISLMFLVL